jgi:sugar lactone lactonase YvrE
VAYDRHHNRTVASSADVSGMMAVMDSSGTILELQQLALLTDQGPSFGGAQGVAVDSDGNYWFALSYYDAQREGRGVVLKLDGRTFALLRAIQDVGLENPNGLLYSEPDDVIVALSETGIAHCFDRDGNLMQVLPTVNVGYRGAISRGELWVAGWLQEGQMSRTNLASGERTLFACTPLANSVAVDDEERVWVAGDTGVSVSARNGRPIASLASDYYANGLTSLNGRTFHVSQVERQGWLRELALVSPEAHLPSLSKDSRTGR